MLPFHSAVLTDLYISCCVKLCPIFLFSLTVADIGKKAALLDYVSPSPQGECKDRLDAMAQCLHKPNRLFFF